MSKFYEFDMDLKGKSGDTVGTVLMDKTGDVFFRLFSADKKTSIRRKVMFDSLIDLAKLTGDNIWFYCKKCKSRISIEKGEFHHGCLKCYE